MLRNTRSADGNPPGGTPEDAHVTLAVTVPRQVASAYTGRRRPTAAEIDAAVKKMNRQLGPKNRNPHDPHSPAKPQVSA